MIDRDQVLKTNDLNCAIIIDSFAVNKVFSVDVQKICFLSISDKYLIEKDETNHDITDFYEFIHFIEGKINKE